MAIVRYVDNTGRVCTCDVGGESSVIGRAPSCQIAIEDDTISREHARIQRDKEGQFTLRDLGSRNRTYLNGQAITESPLAPGDGWHGLAQPDRDELAPPAPSLGEIATRAFSVAPIGARRTRRCCPRARCARPGLYSIAPVGGLNDSALWGLE